jgi:hypothetical protein
MARTSRGNKKKEVNKNADGTTKPNSSLQKSLDSLQVGRSSSCTIEREREGGEAEADEAGTFTSSPLHCPLHFPFHCPFPAPATTATGQAQGQAHEG